VELDHAGKRLRGFGTRLQSRPQANRSAPAPRSGAAQVMLAGREEQALAFDSAAIGEVERQPLGAADGDAALDRDTRLGRGVKQRRVEPAAGEPCGAAGEGALHTPFTQDQP
jgi:hypothetical protein